MAALESARLRLAGRQGRFLYVTTPGAVASGQAAGDEVLSALGSPRGGPARPGPAITLNSQPPAYRIKTS
jgi:hypothetical protein